MPADGAALAPEPSEEEIPNASKAALALPSGSAKPEIEPQTEAQIPSADLRSLTPREWDLDPPNPESDRMKREIAALTKSSISHYLAIQRYRERETAAPNAPSRP